MYLHLSHLAPCQPGLQPSKQVPSDWEQLRSLASDCGRQFTLQVFPQVGPYLSSGQETEQEKTLIYRTPEFFSL